MKEFVAVLFALSLLMISCKDDADIYYKQTYCRMVEEEIITYYESSINNPGGKEETEIYQYKYENNNLIERRHINKYGEFDYWYSYSYNKNNDPIHCVFHIVEPRTTDTLAKYTFDNKKRLSKVVYYANDNITDVNTIVLE